jgi:hypothetical protein
VRDRPRKGFRVLVPLLGTFVALAAAEGTLRLFTPFYLVERQSAYQYDPEPGYRIAPGDSSLPTHPLGPSMESVP